MDEINKNFLLLELLERTGQLEEDLVEDLLVPHAIENSQLPQAPNTSSQRPASPDNLMVLFYGSGEVSDSESDQSFPDDESDQVFVVLF